MALTSGDTKEEELMSAASTPGPLASARRPARDRQRVPGLSIRALEMDDCAAIAQLISLPKVRWGTLRLPFANHEQVRKWIEGNPDRTSLVAVLDGQVVGNAGLIRLQGRQLHVARIGLCVHDDYCGRGIGSALVGALVEAADNWLDLRRLELTVFVDNEPAIRLYKKFGFVIEGTRRADAFRGGVYADSYSMARIRIADALIDSRHPKGTAGSQP
jgi:L-phenylalanine/L-methionine N-acetyltransferase